MPYGADMNEVAVLEGTKDQSRHPFYVEIKIDKDGNFNPPKTFKVLNGGIVRFVVSDEYMKYNRECHMTCSIPSKKDKPGGGTIVIGG